METLESSSVCRLCGGHSGISVDIFDRNENHVRKINAVLPIMVHEMDLLPKQMCHRCSYKLEEFHKFCIECLKTDADLKSQLSWMRKESSREKIGVPMVHIENVKIKMEPPDYDIYDLDPLIENVNYINSMRSVSFPMSDRMTYATTCCRCCCGKKDQSRSVSKDYGGVNNRSKNSSQTSKKNVFTRALQDSGGQREALGENFDNRKVQICNKTTVTRSLRPRKGSVNYVEKKKAGSNSEPKTSSLEFDRTLQRIKVEKEDSFEGRMLRPRKGPVDYLGPKKNQKKDLASSSNSQEEERCTKKHKPDSPKPSKQEHIVQKDTKVKIKEEPMDPEEAISKSKSFRTPKKSEISPRKPETLPKNILANVQNVSRYTKSDAADFHKFKSLTNDSKKCAKGKLALRRITATGLPKYLRNYEVYLRNGKVKRLDVERSMRRLRRNLYCNDRLENSPVKSSKSSSSRISSKLLDNIKHYCEKCGLTFANKELFKLHACYD